MRLGHCFAHLSDVLDLIALDARHIEQLEGLVLVVQCVGGIALGEVCFTRTYDQAIDPTRKCLTSLQLGQGRHQCGQTVVQQRAQRRCHCR